MSKLKRYFTKGQTYFATLVLYQRKCIPKALFDPLRQSIFKMAEKHNSTINAWVILPNHIHLIITPPDNVLDQYIHDMKLSFGVKYRIALGIRSFRLWQSRYWDHIIRDQADMNRHIDYIRYNPVKHDHVKSPFDWKYTSIHDYKMGGYYTDDWGSDKEILFEGIYGE